MQPSIPPASPVPAGRPQPAPGRPGLPMGADRMGKSYFDVSGVRRTSRIPVPVDQFGRIVGTPWKCRRCDAVRWFALRLQGVPVCELHEIRMRPVPLRGQPLLPWSDLWRAADRPLRAAWPGLGLAAAGAGLSEVGVPAAVPVVVALPLGVVAFKAARRRFLASAAKRGKLELDDPGSGKRRRARIDKRARVVGYTTAAASGWLGVAAGLGVDPATTGGAVSLALLAGTWLPPAATWWRHLRDERNRPVPPPATAGQDVPAPVSLNPDEAEVRRIWSSIVAAHKDQRIGTTADGKPVLARRTGRLAGTWLEDWHKVDGGWAATICSEPGDYTEDAFIGSRGAIASAFRMKAGMITVIPDGEDETRALVLAQRTSPIADVVRWTGPASIDVRQGIAPVARYCDGSLALYELWRPGWGVPHVAAFGTTGSGKSEFINLLFTIGRWAHRVDGDRQPHGLVADFLIDPQQGQSFAPVLDDLAAPVACSLDEALLLVRALTQEALRRNRYLSRVEWVDPKRGRIRRGRKWWNPLVDGPILTLTIDEAHDYLSNPQFATMVTKAGRMWRKCGMQLRIATHTPLLSDLGGSMALRDMLTGGFVWVGRTANSLSGPTAFNGRLPVDPRTIPDVPGTAYILTGRAPKPMLARTMWEPDFYDWVRDDADEPIGYPAPLPAETMTAFGPEFAAWVQARAQDEAWAPDTAADPAPDQPTVAVDAVRAVLESATGPMDIDQIDAALRRAGTPYSTRTVREALRKLRESGQVVTQDRRHRLASAATDEAQAEQLDLLAAEESV